MKTSLIASVVLLCAASVPAADSHRRITPPDLDRRLEVPANPTPAAAPAVTAAAGQLAARTNAEAALHARLPRVQIDRDPIHGRVKWLAAYDGFLTGPNAAARGLADGPALRAVPANDPHRIIKAFVNEHAAIFGHDTRALDAARITRDHTAAHNGLRTVRWQQELEGIPVHRGWFMAHVSRNGELVSVSSELLPDLDGAADAAQRQLASKRMAPPISAVQALAACAKNLSFDLDAAQLHAEAPPAGAERSQDFSAPVWRQPARVALVWLPMNVNSVRLCWRVEMSEPKHHDGFELFVDATTGEVLVRHSLTVDASAATLRVFTSDSPSPLSPGYSTPTTNQPPVAARSLLTFTSLDATASPNGWVDDGQLNLRGNNSTTTLWIQTGPGSHSGGPVSGSASRVFDFPLDVSQSPTNYGKASAVNAFYWVNWMHDKLYALGFDEASGNCQQTNFNRGGQGKDSISLYIQDPLEEDNAGMTTYAEGGSPELRLGVFTGPEPDRDSALDAEIILHEYGHALSHRLIGGGTTMSSLQTKGMGEGWSDFYAMAMLSQSGDNVNGNYGQGAYSFFHIWGTSYAQNYYSGSRRYPYTTDMGKNPLTFKDIDPDQADPHTGVPINSALFGFPANEVHMQGEVWCSMLWECRANLINKHGFNTGNQLMLQIVTDALKLTPAEPNFTTARNAILIADAVNNAGANLKELWAGFAKRGLGVDAFAPASANTAGVVESFDSLDDLLVSPGVLPLVQGPLGGPFVPNAITLNLTNDGGSSLTWGGQVNPPFEMTPASGTLSAHGRQTVTLRLNAAAAASFSAGIYQIPVRLTNVTSGAIVQRTISFAVDVAYPPAEQFTVTPGDENDLEATFLTFTPDGSGTRYQVCRSSFGPIGSSFALGGAQVPDFGDDYFFTVTLTNGAQFPFFGKSYSSFTISEYGIIVFGGGETNEVASFTGFVGHFAEPRIAGMSGLYNYTNGIIAWQQLADRVLLTWQGMRVWSETGTKTNTFQLALYFDGRIGMTFLRLDSVKGICGLSAGGGTPPVFAETDLSAAHVCTLPTLSISVPPVLTEGTPVRIGAGSVWRSSPAVIDTTISLTSSDTGEITVPATVIIPAGSTSAVFNITVQNDALRDGTQIAFITASAFNHLPASAPIRVEDNETATLTLSLPATITEGGLFGLGLVSLNAPAGSLVTVTLVNPRPEEINIPPTVFIPAGQTSALFFFIAVNDNRIDGPQNVTITAQVNNWTSGQDTITVLDNESTNLTLYTTVFVSESSGTITNGGRVAISGILPTNLFVAVISDDESEVRTPLFGVFIPAGETNAWFPLFIQDDAVVDGLVIAQLRALAGGFGTATNYVWVFDNDGPPDPFNPYPAHNSTDIPLDARLSWAPLEGELLINGTFETGDLTGWTTADPAGGGGWVVNDGTFDPESSDGPLPPLAGSFSALAQQVGNGTHVLYQDVFIPDGATSATLIWSDRIRNHAGVFDASQQFRVELRNPANDSVLATLFATSANMPAFTDWTSRTSNLAPYRGQSVRLAFVEQDVLGHLDVHLDNVSLAAGAAATTFFDVYLGTNATPTSADFLGTTTSKTLNPGRLAAGTDYYWQVKVRRSSVTNDGPVWHFTTTGDGATNVIVSPFAASWKYVKTGVDLGTAWRSPAYSDNTWPSGTAPLGFGGGQTTLIGYATNDYVTFYFRRRVTLADTNRLAAVTARLKRDDGAIVYVNGTEAFRNNMPARSVDYLTSASSDISGLSELFLVTESIDPSLFIEGANVIAVEIHQYCGRTGCSDDLLFDMELTTRTNVGNLPPTIAWLTPEDFTLVHQPTNLVLSTTLADDGILLGYTVEIFANGVSLAKDFLPPISYTWTNPPPGEYTLVAVATDPGGLSTATPPLHVVVAPAAGRTAFTFIADGADWHFNDSGTDLGTNWAGFGYRESRWKHGPAQLGYGDGDEATLVSYGGHTLNRHITTYFRKSFDLAADLGSLTLRVLRDDGIVVYLNGGEIFRDNLPAGAISYDTLASTSLNPPEESQWLTIPLNMHAVGTLLRQGKNVIAAEVHQASPSSPDLSFDLELVGVGNLLPAVALTNPADNTVVVAPANVLLTATASDPYGSVTNVQFRRNGILLGGVATPPYQFLWNNPPPGWHSLTAVATDDFGASRISSAVNLFVAATVPLTITRNGAFVQLSWPDNAPGYTLETAMNLASPISWTATTNTVAQSGGQFRVTLSAEEVERYFRLRAP